MHPAGESARPALLRELAALQTARARLDAREVTILAELDASHDPAGKQWVREDVACAMRLAPAVARTTPPRR